MRNSDSEANQPPQRQRLASRSGWFRRLLSDLFFVAKRDKKWWLLPLMVLLLILGALLAFAMALGPIAPFIYPLL